MDRTGVLWPSPKDVLARDLDPHRLREVRSKGGDTSHDQAVKAVLVIIYLLQRSDGQNMHFLNSRTLVTVLVGGRKKRQGGEN